MSSEYRLLGRIESSELSELFAAERDGRDRVVIKLFHEKTSDRAYAQHLAVDLRALDTVRERSIAHVLEVGFVKKRLAVVREDVGGYNLGHALQRLNSRDVVLPPPLALQLIIEVLETLGRVHDAGVVHGAVTPGNILLSEDGYAALCDFGALAALESVPALRTAFARGGRHAYRAPELGERAVPTAESDIYSAGAVVYELLTLRLPASDAAVRTRPERPPPPSRINRRLHHRIDPIVLRAIESSPQRRYRTCGEFALALREVLASVGGAPAPEDLAKFVKELFPNEVRISAKGPVPFSDAFRISEISGISLPQAQVVEEVITTSRPLFSGTEVDPTAETQENSAEYPAAPEVQALTTSADGPRSRESALPQEWDAPEGASLEEAPETSGVSTSLEFQKRVRQLENLQTSMAAGAARHAKAFVPATAQSPQPEDAAKTQRRLPRVQPEALQTMATELPLPLERSSVSSGWGWWVVVAAVLGALGFVATAILFRPQPRAPEPAWVSLRPMPVKPAPPPTVAKAPAADCFDPPPLRSSPGFLTVESTRPVRVLIDDDPVCGSATKVPVKSGSHLIVVVDRKTGAEYSQSVRIEAGKTFLLAPIFRGAR